MYGVWFWVYQSTHFIPMFVELYRNTGLSQSGQYSTLFPFFWYNDNKPLVFGFRIVRQPDIRA